MTISHTISHLARTDTLRTATGQVDYHAYDALARRERGRAFRSAFAALAAALQSAWRIGGRRDADPAACQPSFR